MKHFSLLLLLIPCLSVTQNLYSDSIQFLLNEEQFARKLFAFDLNGDGLVDISGDRINPDGMLEYSSIASLDDVCFDYTPVPSIDLSLSDFHQIVGHYDIDQDGDLDLVVLERAGVVNYDLIYLENDGSGSYAEKTVLMSLGQWSSPDDQVEIGDLNNDSFLDFFIFKYSDSGADANLILVSDGLQSYQATTALVNAPNIVSAQLYDFNTNGYLDLLIRTEDSIKWYVNDGNGEFSDQVLVVPSFSDFDKTRACDFNNDGLTDIIGFDSSSELLRYYAQQSDGLFELVDFVPDYINLDLFEVLDYNSDGLDDLIAVEPTSVKVYINGGNSVMTEYVHWGDPFSIYRVLEVADVNNDGQVDILLTNSETFSFREDIECLTLDLSDNTWNKYDIRHRLTDLDEIIWEDFDGDGAIDMLYFADDGEQLLVTFIKDGVFCNRVVLWDQVHYSSVKTVDLDDNGTLDIVALSNTEDAFYWFSNNGDGSFAPKNQVGSLETNSSTAQFEIADMDGDGDQDFIALDYNLSELVVMENTNSLSFVRHETGIASSSLINPVIVDDDRDGLQDIIQYAYSWQVDNVELFRNLGAFQFDSAQIMFESEVLPGKIFVEDMDGDQDLDYLLYYVNTGKCINLDGEVLFEFETGLNGVNAINLVDLTHDGLPDLVTQSLIGGQYDLRIMENLLDSLSSSRSVFSHPSNGVFSAIVDVDGDGVKDLALTNNKKISFVKRNVSGFPIADFVYTDCPSPRLINQSDTYLSNVECNWDLGNGTSSNDTHPLTTYETPGSYEVELQVCFEGLCDTIAKTISVTKIANLEIPDEVFANEPITFFNYSIGYSNFSWVFGDGNVSTEMEPTFSYQTEGTYLLELYMTDSAELNCTHKIEKEIVVQAAVGMTLVHNPIEISPNPSRYETTISVPSNDWRYKIYDLNGRMLYSEKVEQNEFILDTSKLGPGIYYLQFATDQSLIGTNKLIVL